MLVVIPGYVRQEAALDKANEAAVSANDTAADLAKANKEELERRSIVTLENCQTRNIASKNGRDRFDAFFDGLEIIFTTNPEQSPEEQERNREFINNLRTAVTLEPSTEDVDCSGDGKLGPEDYPQ
jgi:hypothetical protein